MAKRRVADKNDNDDQQEGSSSRAKRARFDRHEPEVIEYQAEPKDEPTTTRVTRSRVQDNDGEEDDDSLEDDGSLQAIREQNVSEDPAEQARFEEEHEERIRESIRARGKLEGGVAKFGIIEAIEMNQFMCHKYLTFKFGHNGSGKSAVLSAITVALGGKATATGRGNGLKSFIREGQSVSEVTVQLKNQGDEAYRHQSYGDSIIITRHFTKEGSSSYKIKSRDGKVISTKREELAAICDHMNIQVDNPMNVLTQDSARQFLSASHPSDKYRFFLRGTQLSQLSEEYETCMENVSQMSKVLARKKEALPDLEAQFEEASARFEEASKAREQRHKADQLKRELAWAHVATKKEELREKVEEHAKLAHRLPKIQEKLTEAENEFVAGTEKVEELEAEHQALGNIEHLQEKRTDLQNRMRDNKVQIAAIKNDEKKVEEDLKATRRQIEQLQKKIDDEMKKSAAHTQTKQDETNQKLAIALGDVREAEERVRSFEQQIQAKQGEANELKTEADRADQELQDVKKRLMECQEQVTRCIDQQKNALAPYGNRLKEVIDKIGRLNWYGQKPLGPLGVFVTVKDPAKWAGLLRNTLGGYMSAFAVTDGRDMAQMRKLLKETGNHAQVFVGEVDLFDFSHGEPAPRYLTVLRAIECSNEYVLRVLINQAKIERLLLGESRKEVDNLLLELSGGGTGLSLDLYRVIRYPEGGGSSQPLQKMRPNDPRNLLFTGQDAATQLKHWQAEGAAAEAHYHNLSRQVTESRHKYTDLQRTIETLKQNARGAARSLSEAKYVRDALQVEANEGVPVETAGLEAAKEEQERERDQLLAQFQSMAQKKLKLDETQRPLLEELNVIKQEINEFDAKCRAATVGLLMLLMAHRIDLVLFRRKWRRLSNDVWMLKTIRSIGRKKLAEEQKTVKEAQEREDIVQKEFENWTEKAQNYCERVENPRKAEEVQRQLDGVQKALKEREKRHGASVEEMTIEVNRAQAAYETAQKDLKSMALKRSLRIRFNKWYDFRRHIAFRCKVVFQYHLSNRGYFGKVLFNHQDGTLQLKVQTDEQHGTQGSRDKDPRSLSGGEKSFATICLLLAMWESIGSPIRCLDEFDVFMDAVNRRISMKMMIDTANSSDGKQYVLITPQNMQSVHLGKTVRVHRMSDPERGQGTLAYGQTVA
ncbi:hypothetical protein EW146_g2017 [Bondarzewia mesenterica]|uniref:RecF/RecN/SMC N-terminal domain-containing protein n=1 Tax=Bondarzewia mesenterica TaxID=1095465 RepID=A0A4V3XFW5_9AGAM|nr:hypothetical protein EW146_g2017 [Bondarzewia mesenterica]